MSIKTMISRFGFALAMLCVLGTTVAPSVCGAPDEQASLRRVVLFSRIKHEERLKDYGKSAYSFEKGLRSDVGIAVTRNYYDLFYGSNSLDGDTDWFNVSGGTNELSRIKDLGEMSWDDVSYVPVLPARQASGPIRVPRRGESYEHSSDGQVTRVVVNHIYLLHVKDSDSDFYVMFRVEKLKPSDRCVISWKIVPSPEV